MSVLVKVRVSQAAFDEIAAQFREHAPECFLKHGQIDMTGIALERHETLAVPPGIVLVDANELDRQQFRDIYFIDQLTTESTDNED
jgi:hypothetical protein